MKSNENEEISITKLIIIPIKHWKIVLVSFLLLYILGVVIFIANKKSLEAKNTAAQSAPSKVIINEVSNGYIWINYNIKDNHSYSTDEILDMLFKDGNLSGKFLRWPGLTCQRSNDTISFQMNGEEVLRISVVFTADRTTFSTEQVMKSDKSVTNPPDLEDIHKINQVVVDTFLNEANVRVNSYRSARKLINQTLMKSDMKSIIDAQIITYSLAYHSTYMNLEKEYIQTSFNISSTISQAVPGMPLKRFLTLFFLVSFLISLTIVFFLEFSKDSNLVSEVKKALNEKNNLLR